MKNFTIFLRIGTLLASISIRRWMFGAGPDAEGRQHHFFGPLQWTRYAERRYDLWID